MNDVGTLPLGTGDINNPDRAFGGDHFLHSADVGFLSSMGDARSDVDTVLHHLKSVIQKKFSEVRVAFSLVLSLGREIKCYHEPAHFEFCGIHGL